MAGSGEKLRIRMTNFRFWFGLSFIIVGVFSFLLVALISIVVGGNNPQASGGSEILLGGLAAMLICSIPGIAIVMTCRYVTFDLQKRILQLPKGASIPLVDIRLILVNEAGGSVTSQYGKKYTYGYCRIGLITDQIGRPFLDNIQQLEEQLPALKEAVVPMPSEMAGDSLIERLRNSPGHSMIHLQDQASRKQAEEVTNWIAQSLRIPVLYITAQGEITLRRFLHQGAWG